ncbi:4Fe-4S dicluster domain-containing protein [Ectothiorhodospiraceae bacterium BW-2]|nr:4Fe-4S dicluster domain-containing protein [Ectothiorhodospiraceae bacterium BW-2]
MNSNQPISSSRRHFLLGSGKAAAAASLGGGVFLYGAQSQARAPEEPASNKVRWGMLIDTTQCADGCSDCVTACQSEHGWGGEENSEKRSRPDQQAQWIRKVKLKDLTTQATHSLPIMCQHCDNPPCVDVCPTKASMIRADGVVLVDRHACIGCRYCMMACPYKARSFIHESISDQKPYMPRGKGCVESCTLCVHKLDAGENETACSSACEHNAILVGDLNDPESKISQRLKSQMTTQIRADLGLNPGVRYIGI